MEIIVDTLSFRAHGTTLENFLGFLGLANKDFQWTPGGKFNRNYLNSLWYNGIVIGYDGAQGWEFYVTMSGKGCRTYEDLNPDVEHLWEKLFKMLKDLTEKNLCAITRVDLACDSFDDTLNLQRIEKHIEKDKYLSRCSSDCVRLLKFGEECLYVGSRQSVTLLRIYNKKLERGYSKEDTEIVNWYRCELQLRDEHARQVVCEIGAGESIGKIYAGHCIDHMRFTTKPNKHDGCQSRLNTAPWWNNFLVNAAPIKWSTPKGSEYNMSKLERYAVHNAGSSILTMIKAKELTAEQLYNTYVNSEEIQLRPDQVSFIEKCNKRRTQSAREWIEENNDDCLRLCANSKASSERR